MRYSSTLLKQFILGEIRSFIVHNINVWSYKVSGKNFWPIYSLLVEIKNVKVLKNALCLIIGYLVAMETCVTLFWSMHFCKVHSVGPINVCTNFEINQKSLRRPIQKLWINSGFNVFDDLELWPMFYSLPHKKYSNLLAKFHMNPSRVNGWYGRG